MFDDLFPERRDVTPRAPDRRRAPISVPPGMRNSSSDGSCGASAAIRRARRFWSRNCRTLQFAGLFLAVLEAFASGRVPASRNEWRPSRRESPSVADTRRMRVFRYARLYRLSHTGGADLLAPAMATTEPPAARGELCVLRLVGSALPGADRDLDDRRLLLRQGDCAPAHRRIRGTAPPADRPGDASCWPCRWSINLGFLAIFKYFNFFVDSFAACALGVRVPSCPDHDAAHSAAARHFVLHLSGGGLHRRRLSPEARAGRFAGRLRALHQPVSASHRRPDSAAQPPAAAGAGAARGSTASGSSTGCC